MSKLIHLRKS